MRVAIIGGGPSRLITLEYLRTVHHYFDIEAIDAKLFEASPNIGRVFRYAYEGAEV